MNFFKTPHNELTITTKDDSMKLRVKNIKSLPKIISSILLCLACCLISLYVFTKAPIETPIFGLKIPFLIYILALIIIILSFIFNLVAFDKILTRNISKKKRIAYNYTSNFLVVYFGPLIIIESFSWILSLVSLGRYEYFFQSIIFLILGIGLYLSLFIEMNDSVEINLIKNIDLLEVKATEYIPTINFAPNSFVKTILIFDKQVPNIHLAIMPYKWNLRYYYNQIRTNNLNCYQWLTLDQAEKISTKKFTCYLVTNKTDFPNNFGLRIGNKLSIESLNEVYNFFIENIPISVIQLTNKPIA